MNPIVKQHLLCATRAELDDYFKDVVPIDENTNFRGNESRFEIPTWTIKQQLDEIAQKDEPKTGFVWYIIRAVLNKPDGTFDIEMVFRQEMVWIKNGTQFEPYIMKTANNLLQYTAVSNIFEQK